MHSSFVEIVRDVIVGAVFQVEGNATGQFIGHVVHDVLCFEGNNGMWRAIESPLVHHLFYITIILWEAIALGIISYGTLKLWKARMADDKTFHAAKDIAAAGLTISMLQWYIAFICVGAEWFLMWQSEIWNGQDAAMRMFLMMGLSLIFLMQKECAETNE